MRGVWLGGGGAGAGACVMRGDSGGRRRCPVVLLSFFFLLWLVESGGAGASCVPRYGAGRYLLNLTVEGPASVRPLLLNVPAEVTFPSDGLEGGAVVGFHGWHSNPWYYDALANLTNMTSRYKMVLALPFGTGLEESFYCCPENVTVDECSDGTRLDASSRACGWKNGDAADRSDQFANVDDIAYARQIVEFLVSEVCVDPAKIFATGLSDGGAMTARAACDAADIFAGVATMSGGLDLEICDAAEPLAYLEFCGTDDGACNVSSYSTYDTWVALNDCGDTNWHLTYESATTKCRAADGCDGGSLVEQCLVAGLGDAIPGHDRSGPIVPGTTYVPQAATNIDSVKYAFDKWSSLFPSKAWPDNPAFDGPYDLLPADAQAQAHEEAQ